jgi:meso-butanediol dehydrogenase/(S,S)-butanediol dehydrogenase/diacetyl reductase
MASVSAYGGSPLRSAYAPAKAGIVNLTMVMAVELGKYNINVNCLAPGLVLVSRIKRLVEQKVFSLEGVLSRTPLGRLSEPEDVAKAAVFLVSDEAAAISGITLPIDAGWMANRT